MVEQPAFLASLATAARQAQYCLTVCTGSALLAKTGLLDGLQATSNKRSFAWVKAQRPQVQWQAQARWCVAGKFYTSSGISAGLDMALGFVADCCGEVKAEETARRIEYIWHKDSNADPFAFKECPEA